MLTVSSPGAVPAPRLCGTNHGYHLYVEVGGEDCAQLSLTQGSIAATREWDITITQVVCPGQYLQYNVVSDNVCLDVAAPPLGCAQYFTGTTGTVYSYNYDSSFHLSNLDYK